MFNGPHLTPGRQASAGTGKSYLLSTIYLWCIVNGLNCKAAAPTGIAAANVEVEGTDVVATTLHALLELDAELQTKLDLAKLDHAKVAALMKLQVLLLDEVSMLDTDAWNAICSILCTIDHSRRPDAQDGDAFGSLHVILFRGGPKGSQPPGDAGLPPSIGCHPPLRSPRSSCTRMCTATSTFVCSSRTGA